MKTRSQAVLAAVALVAGAAPALAVDEITVTALRREQALQDVPVAVSAFNAEALEARQIDLVKDIGQNVPNLQTYTVTAGAQAIQVHSRGASIQNPGFNLSESPVGIYQDDVYFGRMASANLELSDIERIEVLRGPQGTLYGRNTIAGAIKVISRTPGNESWANGSIGVGNYETFKVTGSVGGPIEADALAGSLSFSYDDRNDGWQVNPVTGSEPGEYENLVIRSKLHWYQGDVFDAVVTGWAADLENDGYNGVPQRPFFGSGPNPNFDPAPADSAPLGDFYGNYSPDGVNYGESDQAGASLVLSWDLGAVTVKSITGYTSIDDRFGFDLAGGDFLGIAGTPGLLIHSDSEFDQWSEELQVLGKAFDDRLNYLAGVFYLNEDGTQDFSGELGAPFFDERIESETDSYAAFLDASFEIIDGLSVNAGVRYTKDEKEFTDTCSAGFGCQSDAGFGPGRVSRDDDWDETTFKAGVDYKLNEDQLVYLTFAQGFQSGGYRTLCFGNLRSDDPTTPIVEGCAGTPFDPQTVDSFELGYKGDLFDKTLRLNADVFYAMYDDIQQIVINNTGIGFPIQNIGEVDVYGVELEVQWTPIDNLNIFANAGFQESDFGSVDPYSPPAGLGDPCGPSNPQPCVNPTDELPSNPQFQGKIGFDYTVGVSEMVEVFYGLDLFYTDDYFSEARNQVQIDSYSRLNGFVGIGDPDKTWQLTLAGRNITDEEDYVSGIFANGFTNVRTALPPAEFMLTLKVNY